MTSNPLARRQAPSYETPQIPRNPGNSYAEDLAIYYNARRLRPDVEWFVDSNGAVRCGDRADFSRWNTLDLERKAEAARRRWIAGQAA